MTKADLIANLRTQLESKISVMKSALADSSESASGDETKSEGAEESLSLFLNFEAPDYEISDEVGPGALVEVDQEGEICFYFLAPTAGGLMTSYLGCEVTVITPDSRLYQELSEKKMGETLESPALTITGLE